jgi:hypothetical protein
MKDKAAWIDMLNTAVADSVATIGLDGLVGITRTGTPLEYLQVVTNTHQYIQTGEE